MIFQTERLILHAFGDLHIEIRKNRRTKNEREDQMFCPPGSPAQSAVDTLQALFGGMQPNEAVELFHPNSRRNKNDIS